MQALLPALAAEAAATSRANISTLRLASFGVRSTGTRSAQKFGMTSTSSDVYARISDMNVFVEAVPSMKSSLKVLDLRDVDMWKTTSSNEWTDGNSWMFCNAVGKLLHLQQLILYEAS